MKLLIDGRTMEKGVYMYLILLTNHQPQAKFANSQDATSN